MLAAELAANPAHQPPRFVILVSGFVPGAAGMQAAANLITGVVGIPSLHVMGTADQLVPPERSQALAALFDGARVFEHERGHMVPSSAGARSELSRLLDDQGFTRAQ